ncbi:MAG TPA: lipoprotein [Burkholderiales bacterium]|nr:lipoprotein [Burkholderiales bacterium]
MRFLSLLLFAALLVGCGYKGALYLPENPPSEQPQTAPQPEKPQKQDSDQQQGPQAQ